MRGIPDKLATREDVYNVAMDLPPDQAMDFLDKLTPAKVKGLLNAEELTILKGNVAWARWRDQAHKARLAQKKTELKRARKLRASLGEVQRHQRKDLQRLTLLVKGVRARLDQLAAPMADRRSDLAEKISLEKNRLARIDQDHKTHVHQVRSLAGKKGATARRIQALIAQLKKHEKDLAAGHSPAAFKKIRSANQALAGLLETKKQLEKQLQQLPGKIKKVQDQLDQLTAPMTDCRQDLAEKISLAENRLVTLNQQHEKYAGNGKKMAAQKAAIKTQVQQLEKQLAQHKKDLAAGYSKADLEKIQAATGQLDDGLACQAQLYRDLAKNGADLSAAAVLIDGLKSEIGDLKNG